MRTAAAVALIAILTMAATSAAFAFIAGDIAGPAAPGCATHVESGPRFDLDADLAPTHRAAVGASPPTPLINRTAPPRVPAPPVTVKLEDNLMPDVTTSPPVRLRGA